MSNLGNEAESLFAKIDPKSFGDRVFIGRPETNRKKKERDPEFEPGPYAKRRCLLSQGSVLKDDCFYEPKSKETMSAYEAMLGVIQSQLGGQPLSVVRGAADEILAVLKKETGFEKKFEIEKLLNPLPNYVFDQLVSIGRLITDFQDGSVVTSMDDGVLDDDVGVAVVFEENEDVDNDLDMVQDDDDEEYDDDVIEPGMLMGGSYLEEANEDMRLNVHDIDAYWLQRRISQAYDQQIDPIQCQKLAEDVFQILAAEGSDDREVETKLLVHLQFDKFHLIKFLLCNRLKIVWCTRLARSGGQQERKKIEYEMLGLGTPGLAAILKQLHATRATSKERQNFLEKSIREEARPLKDGNKIRGDEAADNRLLDLESIAFQQGGLLMANKKCDLPNGSWTGREKEYEEVHIPRLIQKEWGSNEQLVNISSMPEWAQPAFAGMSKLNRVQSKVYDTALFTAENLLLCAPTGAGKTNVAMLTILQQMALNRNEDGSFNHSNYKIVYVAPMKALVAEVVINLSKRLDYYGVKVKELSGDQTLSHQQIEETQIIVTTPEKWDIVTRKSLSYTQLVKLVIIDEVHLLHDHRGPVLESIVARTVRQIEHSKEHIRLVGLSATLPNYEDVAFFLRVNLKKGLFYFDNSYRPCPLDQKYIGITVKKPLQRFQLMNDICYEKVMLGAGKHQILIFVHSRKETAKTARAIRDSALANDTLSRFLKEDSASHEILHSQIDMLKSSDLKDLLPHGFAIHHAGLARSDRQLIEELYRNGHVQVLVSTATLAWGVNLPAHTVIIKGTQIYSPEKGAWTELSTLDVMQMLGRAGRPQFDTYGEGIIITGHSELQYYLSLMNQQLPIESQFVSMLADQLNAEIVLGTVKNVREACHWLGYTYLYIRMLRNPTLYGLATDDTRRDITLEARRADLIHSAATLLDKNNLIIYDRKSGYFQVTYLGRIASYYYITHKTISTYNEHLKPTMGDIELYRLFSLSDEFKYVSVRQDEKMELAKLLDRVPIPIKESLEEPSAKINVLLQVYISRLKLEGLSITSDMVFITQSAGRLLRALFEIVVKRGWAQLAKTALNLSKMVNMRMWSVQTPLRQFTGIIPNEILNKLEKKDLAWDMYYDLSSQELGELIRFPKMGRTLHKSIHQFPKLNLAAHVQPITHTLLKVELTITPDFQWEDKVHGYVEPFWVIVEDNDGEFILHHEYFLLKKQYINEDHSLNFTIPICEPLPPQYFIRVASDRWLGSEAVLPVDFRHLILPEKNPPPTELLDLQPLSLTALRNPSYEALYQDFDHFNPVQTQVFTVLYSTDDNVLLAAPTGSGKTICAEFAILRSHQNNNILGMRVVYIASMEATAKERYRDWDKKFGIKSTLGMRVAELTGETTTDLKLLEKCQIVISTPEKWDALSRRWKQLKHIQQVSLFIVDDLHLIGSEGGHILEVIVSRMRYIASQPKNKIRIVALSTSLANAKDLGVWIGAASHGFFNFPPGARHVPSEILHIQGVESHFHHFLHDNINAEVVAGVIENKEHVVDYLTRTFMYRRLTRNPNYYNLQGVSYRHLCDYLSELVENTLGDLNASKCLAIEDDMHLSPLNLGMIASYYYLSYTTVELFSSLLTSKTKMKGLLEILASASEYAHLPIRPGEEDVIRRLINHNRFSFEEQNLYTDPHVKANVLLQAHFSRKMVGGILASDQREVLICASRLLQAMVDVISSSGWLSLALLTMEVSQMASQGMWEHDSMLLQLSHFTKDLAKKCHENPGKSIETVFDLGEMEDDERRQLLQMSDSQLLDIAKFCNRYPNIDMTYEVLENENVRTGEDVTLQVILERDMAGRTEVGPLDSPIYPKVKEEGWWLVVGDTASNQLLAIKRVSLQNKSKFKLKFAAPSSAGNKSYTLYFMCDSYRGCDQEYSFSIDVREATAVAVSQDDED